MKQASWLNPQRITDPALCVTHFRTLKSIKFIQVGSDAKFKFEESENKMGENIVYPVIDYRGIY
jgi:hypothetical protein